MIDDFIVMDNVHILITGIQPVRSLWPAGEQENLPPPVNVMLDRTQAVFQQVKIVPCSVGITIDFCDSMFFKVFPVTGLAVIHPSINYVNVPVHAGSITFQR